MLQAVAVGVAALLLGAPARAVDPFEIQVYDGTANAPGVPGLELHANHVFSGLREATPPELPQHGTTHLTLEPSLGLFAWWEAGAYFQTAVRRDGTFDYAGAKLRSKFVTPREWDPAWRLGVNFELSLLPQRYEADRWATEIRPIAAWETRSFLVAANPIIDQSLAGAGASDGPSFEPAATAVYKIEDMVSVGFEYYANLGAIASGFLPVGEQEHYLYGVANVLGVRDVEVNAGVGAGLTEASNRVVVKLVLGYTFGRPGSKEDAKEDR